MFQETCGSEAYVTLLVPTEHHMMQQSDMHAIVAMPCVYGLVARPLAQWQASFDDRRIQAVDVNYVHDTTQAKRGVVLHNVH